MTEARDADATMAAYGKACSEARIVAHEIADKATKTDADAKVPEGNDAAEFIKACVAKNTAAYASYYVPAFNEAFDRMLADELAVVTRRGG